MGLKLSKDLLNSRIVRKSINGGERFKKLDISGAIGLSRDSDSGVITSLFNFARGAVGFLWSSLSFLGFSVTTLFSWLFVQTQRLSRFNWNATDRELRSVLNSQNVALASIWGSFVGQGIGWLSGITVGYGIGLICPVIGSGVLARSIATRVGTEALEELRFGLQAAVVNTIEVGANKLLINGYIQFRRLLKTAPFGALETLFGEDAAIFIQKEWGNEGGPNLSFSNTIEEQIESIESDALRAFVESAFDEGFDSFIEAGFIIANELDSAYSSAKAAQETSGLGPERKVLLYPDRRTDERVVVAGKEAVAKQEIQSTISQYRLVGSRDVGQIVGQPLNDWVRAQPQRRKLTVIFRNQERPPWRREGVDLKESTITIPDADLGLTWTRLKQVLRPYLWGEWRATAQLDNGRQMAVYGASKQEAENTLIRCLTLSTAEISTLNTSQEVLRHPDLKKHTTQVYPAYATLLVRRDSVDRTGRTFINGDNQTEETIRIELWPDEEPPDLEPLQ
ncbi:MAG: hypothetical protein AAF215_27940 [Cyanobacteria bacterium P01_A01_bin.123]